MLLRINLILLIAFALGMIAISIVVTSTLQQNAVQGEEHVPLAGKSFSERRYGEQPGKRSSGYQICHAQSIISE